MRFKKRAFLAYDVEPIDYLAHIEQFGRLLSVMMQLPAEAIKGI